MTLEEIYKYCSDYPGLNCKQDGGEIIVYDSIFNNGWNFFMITEEDGKVEFFPILLEMEISVYITSNFVKYGPIEDTAFEQKGDEVVDLTQEKLKEYLDRLSTDIKKTKEKIRKEAIKQDFVK
jgi:uncharacterized protein YrzB (UPF0473 family)